MQVALRTLSGFTNQWFLNDPQVHVARAREKFDAEGRLNDEATCTQVVELLTALGDLARRLKQAPA